MVAFICQILVPCLFKINSRLQTAISCYVHQQLYDFLILSFCKTDTDWNYRTGIIGRCYVYLAKWLVHPIYYYIKINCHKVYYLNLHAY